MCSELTFYCPTYHWQFLGLHVLSSACVESFDSFAMSFFSYTFNYMAHNNMICHLKGNSEFMYIRCHTFQSVVYCRASSIPKYNFIFFNKWSFICNMITTHAYAFGHADISFCFEWMKREISFEFFYIVFSISIEFPPEKWAYTINYIAFVHCTLI